MYCFFQFSKAQYTLEKNTDLEKDYSKRNLEQMKKLDSFSKKLSVNQVNFSGYTWEGQVTACFFL